MSAILEKRTRETITYTIDLTDALGATETVSSVTSVNADQAGLTFGSPSVNGAPITFSDGRVAATGKAILFSIAGGTIQTGQLAQLYTIRAEYVSSLSNDREATVLLNVTDVAD